MGLLESVHLYRKVPTDLTDATRLGGFISLMCAALMAYLFISNVQEYLTVTTSTDVALDDSGDIDMRIYFNITMVRATACVGWVAAREGGVAAQMWPRRRSRSRRADPPPRVLSRRSGYPASSPASTSLTSWAPLSRMSAST